MRPYLHLVASEFRRQATYRLALAAGVFTNGVFGLLRAGVMLAAVAGAGGMAGGYDRDDAIAYVLWGQALIGAIPLWSWSEVATRVRTGDIAVDLARPMDLQLYWWCRDLGRAGMQFLGRGIPILLIGTLLLPVVWPTAPRTYLLGLASLLLGLAVNFVARYGMNLISMWTLDVAGYMIAYGLLVQLLSGFFVPVGFFPPFLQAIAHNSPFPSMYQTPIDLLTGRVDGVDALRLLAVQVGWLLVLLVITRVAQHFGTRKLVIQGG
ncbi:ABC transporter permease [Propionibacteriaceae bacterium Y2011]|uniref:ABC transporter permease n=1 Tax=Microlunatus sp. Y2014 TaxID=3418488 RepID=UPI003B4B3E25